MNIRIGTRNSSLAIIQAKITQKCLEQYAKKSGKEISVEIVSIITSGDKHKRNLSGIEGKERFTKEIEESLLQNCIDIAVHSMKDIPAIFSDKVSFGAFLEREVANDVLISNKYNSISEIPIRGKIGTSSIRRALQLPNCEIVELSGNVDSRIKKYESQNLDGIILAYAGLKRLNMENKIKEIIPYDKMLPSIGQGVIALQTLKDNVTMLEILQNISHSKTEICAKSERAFIETINGNCRTPLAGIAQLTDENTITFSALLATKIGIFHTKDTVKISDAKDLGIELAKKLIIDSKFNTHAIE